MKFLNYIKAAYQLLWVKSHEEHRVLIEYVAEIATLKHEQEVFHSQVWDVADGIRTVTFKKGVLESSDPIPETAADPLLPLTWLDEKAPENTILFLKDYHPFLKKEFQDSTLITRKIRNLVTKFKAQGKVLVILSPTVEVPLELDKEMTVIEYKLPEAKDLRIVLKSVCAAVGAPYPKEDTLIINSALGMTSTEAENAFSVSLIEANKFDDVLIRKEKAQIVKKTGILEVIDSNLTLEDIGGLENLKEWLIARQSCFTSEAKNYGVTPPKGMLLVGVPGCGKSLVCKVVSTAWGRPLLRLDMGSVFGSYVGESEHNMKRVLDLSESISPCVLWCDEIEKSMSGNKAGMESHETTRRVFQLLLTWMQDRTADVFLVATANSIQSLPPELIRPGRIDATFWIDLPDTIQRAEIFGIHLRKLGRTADMFLEHMPELMKACAGFSGAEIEVWIKESLVRAYSRKHKNLELADLMDTVKDITPIAKLMANDIENARKWAKDRGTKNASIVHEEVHAEQKPRKIVSGPAS